MQPVGSFNEEDLILNVEVVPELCSPKEVMLHRSDFFDQGEICHVLALNMINCPHITRDLHETGGYLRILLDLEAYDTFIETRQGMNSKLFKILKFPTVINMKNLLNFV